MKIETLESEEKILYKTAYYEIGRKSDTEFYAIRNIEPLFLFYEDTKEKAKKAAEVALDDYYKRFSP